MSLFDDLRAISADSLGVEGPAASAKGGPVMFRVS